MTPKKTCSGTWKLTTWKLGTWKLGTWKLTALLCLLGLPLGQAVDAQGPSPSAQPSEPTASAPAETTTLSFPSDDRELYDWLVAEMEQFPAFHDLNKLTREQVDALNLVADQVQIASRHHLESFRDSPLRAEVARIHGRVLVLNQARYLSAMDKEYQRLNGQRPAGELVAQWIEDYTTAMLATVEEGLKPLRQEASRLYEIKGEALMMSNRTLEAAEAFREALSLWPEHDRADLIAANRCDALWRAEQFEEAESELKTYLQTRPRSTYFADMFFILTKCYRNTGRVERALAAWDQYQAYLEKLAGGQPLSDPALGESAVPWVPTEEGRLKARVYADRAEFYRGFFNFALGNKELALQHLNTFLDRCEQAEAAGQLNQSTMVYKVHQSVPYIQFIVSMMDKPAAPLELPDEDWVIPASPHEPGKVRLVMFCPLNRATERQWALFERLGALVQERPEQLDMVWIADSRKDLLEYYESSHTNLTNLAGRFQFPLACGLDGIPGLPLHEAYTCNPPGTAQLVVVDPNGNTAWKVIDPLERDLGLIRGVVDRLLGQ